jgi:hypothetical protein
MSDDVEGPRAVFLETLSEHIAALSALEAKICSLLMKEMDLEDEARGVVERLIVYVTTEFPVTEDEENWDESAASELIDRAQAVSEKFLAFYEVIFFFFFFFFFFRPFPLFSSFVVMTACQCDDSERL